MVLWKKFTDSFKPSNKELTGNNIMNQAEIDHGLNNDVQFTVDYYYDRAIKSINESAYTDGIDNLNTVLTFRQDN